MTVNNIVDSELEEKKKLYENSIEYNQNLKNFDHINTIATQVDYVSLIMARNYGDWKLNENDDQNQLIDKKNDFSQDCSQVQKSMLMISCELNLFYVI
jgi:hypothetical protein